MRTCRVGMGANAYVPELHAVSFTASAASLRSLRVTPAKVFEQTAENLEAELHNLPAGLLLDW